MSPQPPTPPPPQKKNYYIGFLYTFLRKKGFTRFRGLFIVFSCFFDTEIWPGQGPSIPWKWSPPSPGSLKAILLFSRTRGCEGRERGTTRNFLHSFPLSGTLVVQSYCAWILFSKGNLTKRQNSIRTGVGWVVGWGVGVWISWWRQQILMQLNPDYSEKQV